MKSIHIKTVSLVLIFFFGAYNLGLAQTQVRFALRALSYLERTEGAAASDDGDVLDVRFPTFRTLARIRMPAHYPDGWDPKFEHVLDVSGPPIAICGPGITTPPDVAERLEQILERLGDIIYNTLITLYGIDTGRARQTSEQFVETLRSNLTIQVVRADPVHSPALFLNRSSQEYLFADYNPDNNVLTMREDAFWNLEMDEFAELLYLVKRTMETLASQLNAALLAGLSPEDMHEIALQLRNTLEDAAGLIFAQNADNTPLIGRMNNALRPSYYQAQPVLTGREFILNTSLPLQLESTDLAGTAPGTMVLDARLHLSPDAMASMEAAVSLNALPSVVDVYGRSHSLNLGEHVVVRDPNFGDIVGVVRCKANVYLDELGRPHVPRMVRYHGGGAPAYIVGVDGFGRVVHIPHPGQPLGTMRIRNMQEEYGMSRKFWEKGILVAYPCGYVERKGPEFRYEEQATGSLLQIMPVNAGRRLYDEINERLVRIRTYSRQARSEPLIREIVLLGALVETWMHHIRFINDKGFIHGYPHVNNFTKISLGDDEYMFLTHDLDNSREKEGMSLDEALALQINDVRLAITSVLSCLGPENIENLSAACRQLGLPSIEQHIVRGYFGELADNLGIDYTAPNCLDTIVDFLTQPEPMQQPVSWSSHPVVSTMRTILAPEELQALNITPEQLRQALPNPVLITLDCETAMWELRRMKETAQSLGVGLKNDPEIDPVQAVYINRDLLSELQKGNEGTKYIPFMDLPRGVLLLTERGSPMHERLLQESSLPVEHLAPHAAPYASGIGATGFPEILTGI